MTSNPYRLTVLSPETVGCTPSADPRCQAVPEMPEDHVPQPPHRRTRPSEATESAAPTTLRDRAADLTVELALFLSSYAPLFLILAIRFRSSTLVVACAALAVLGFAAGISVLVRFRQVARSSWAVRTVEDRGAEVAGYLATYLLPFVTVTEPDVRDVIGYMLFFVIVAVIYIRSSLVQINPTLYLFGWRLYAIEIGDGWNGYLLARGPVRRGTDVTAVRMTERLFVSYARRHRQ
jgi:hypothetical protein